MFRSSFLPSIHLSCLVSIERGAWNGGRKEGEGARERERKKRVSIGKRGRNLFVSGRKNGRPVEAKPADCLVSGMCVCVCRSTRQSRRRAGTARAKMWRATKLPWRLPTSKWHFVLPRFSSVIYSPVNRYSALFFLLRVFPNPPPLCVSSTFLFFFLTNLDRFQRSFDEIANNGALYSGRKFNGFHSIRFDSIVPCVDHVKTRKVATRWEVQLHENRTREIAVIDIPSRYHCAYRVVFFFLFPLTLDSLVDSCNI